MDTFTRFRTRFNSTPLILRIVAAASLGVGAAFTVFPLVPSATFNLSGTEVSWQELWRTRLAVASIVVGGLMLWVGAAILLRRIWVRPILVVIPVLELLPFQIVHWWFGAPNPVPSISMYLLMCSTWSIIAAFYLFGTSGPRGYFENAV
jgi:hypothetical protein